MFFFLQDHTEFMDIYGLMTVSGVPKPGWRAFQMLHEYVEESLLRIIILIFSVWREICVHTEK